MGLSAQRVHLAPPVRESLQHKALCQAGQYREVLRSRIVLMAAAGRKNSEIARALGCTEKTARKWRNRFVDEPSTESLQDAPRSGRPAQIPVTVRCELIRLACQRPEDCKAPFRKIWTLDSLKDQLRSETQHELSRTEIHRILHAEEIRPHRVRMWLHSPDPDFTAKVKRICSLYLNPPLGSTVLCVDEKTGMQALERKYPMRFAEGRLRQEYEYIRHGTRSLIASFEPKTGNVLGYCAPTRGLEDLKVFMEALAKRYDRGKVFVIWDNLNTHHNTYWKQEFNRRHAGRFRFVYTPLHASWTNQVEIWFGILHRRLLKHGSFVSADELARQVLKWIQHWNRREAHPFKWTFQGK